MTEVARQPDGGSFLSDSTRDDAITDVLSDWSGTGRGLHVDFDPQEVVPLKEGRFLGQGIAWVHETEVKGYKLAWKRMRIQRKMNGKERKEVDVMTKLNQELSHEHIVRMIGSYTHYGQQRLLGLLIYPVAICDLHTFFEDAAAYWAKNADQYQTDRLKELGYFEVPKSGLKNKAWPIYSQIGCLVSAVAYLHRKGIRHKDLKPQNILLSKDHVYLSDFGLATDFSTLTQSATEGGGGTPRYLAPEIQSLSPAGRAADIFSLGCVLLEILVFHHKGTLERFGHDRLTGESAYHLNLDKVRGWLPYTATTSPRRHHMIRETRLMLSKDPTQRPNADEILYRMNLCDQMLGGVKQSIFGDCCRTPHITEQQQHQQEVLRLETTIHDLEKSVMERRTENTTLQHHLRYAIPTTKTSNSQVQQLEQLLEFQRRQSMMLREENDNLRSQVAGLSAERKKARVELQLVTSGEKANREKLEKLERGTEDLQDALNNAETQVGVYRTQISREGHELQSKVRELATVKQSWEACKGEIMVLSSQLQDANDKGAMVQKVLETSLDHCGNEITKLQEKLNDSKMKHENESKEHAITRARLTDENRHLQDRVIGLEIRALNASNIQRARTFASPSPQKAVTSPSWVISDDSDSQKRYDSPVMTGTRERKDRERGSHRSRRRRKSKSPPAVYSGFAARIKDALTRQ